MLSNPVTLTARSRLPSSFKSPATRSSGRAQTTGSVVAKRRQAEKSPKERSTRELRSVIFSYS